MNERRSGAQAIRAPQDLVFCVVGIKRTYLGGTKKKSIKRERDLMPPMFEKSDIHD